MEKSSLDYREKLYSQIQEEYGKLVYTYTCLLYTSPSPRDCS